MFNRRKSSADADTYELSIAGGERKRNIPAAGTSRKDAIHQAWRENWLDPDLGGAENWDEISIKRRRK